MLQMLYKETRYKLNSSLTSLGIFFTQTLTSINLSSNQIGPKEVQILANALQRNQVISIVLSLLHANYSNRRLPQLTSALIQSDQKECSILPML